MATATAPSPTARRSGAGGGATGTSRSRRPGLGWLGLVPYFAFVGLFLLLPMAVILFGAFRRTDRVRDPVTQQVVGRTSFTGHNVTSTFHGIYRTSLVNSVELSAITAVVAGVVGVLLAHAVLTSRSGALRQVVTAAAAVMANFGGIPLAFLFIATIGNAGTLTALLQDSLGVSVQDDLHLRLTTVAGISVVYLYFLIPLMVLVMTPALEGLKPQWAEAADNLGASRWEYWRLVAGPVLLPTFLGSLLLLFCSAFSAYATANALVGQSFPLLPTQIANVLSGNVLSGQENLGAALALDMVVVVVPLTGLYLALQRRTTRWLS